jgi:hypothetical protein
MELVMVTVPNCPNAPMLEARLAQALAESGATAAATITRRTVSDAGQRRAGRCAAHRRC